MVAFTAPIRAGHDVHAEPNARVVGAGNADQASPGFMAPIGAKLNRAREHAAATLPSALRPSWNGILAPTWYLVA